MDFPRKLVRNEAQFMDLFPMRPICLYRNLVYLGMSQDDADGYMLCLVHPAIYSEINSRIMANVKGFERWPLEELSLEDRNTIRGLLPKDAIDVSAAFEGVHGCAKQLQRQCADERWSWRYKDRQVYPFEKMDKVLQFLDRFKSVIDLATNADPVQFGLPWAGIRVILEVCDILAHLPLSKYTDTVEGRTSRPQSAGCPDHRHGNISIRQQPA